MALRPLSPHCRYHATRCWVLPTMRCTWTVRLCRFWFSFMLVLLHQGLSGLAIILLPSLLLLRSCSQWVWLVPLSIRTINISRQHDSTHRVSSFPLTTCAVMDLDFLPSVVANFWYVNRANVVELVLNFCPFLYGSFCSEQHEWWVVYLFDKSFRLVLLARTAVLSVKVYQTRKSTQPAQCRNCWLSQWWRVFMRCWDNSKAISMVCTVCTAAVLFLCCIQSSEIQCHHYVSQYELICKHIGDSPQK